MPQERICLSNEDMTAEIGPQGGVILSLTWRRVALIRATPAGREADPLASGCFPLVPFGNRVRGNQFEFEGARHALRPNHADPHYLHGDGWLSRWDVAERTRESVTLSLRHAGDATPYTYSAEEAFELGADGLRVMLSVRNEGDAALPFGLGLHPYFPRSPDTTLRAMAGRHWPEAEDFLPGPAIPVPDALDFTAPRPLPRHWVNAGFDGWDGTADIIWPEARTRLRIEADAAFGAFVLFVSDSAYDAGYAGDWFCFEPMTHAPDGHHQPDLGGLTVLAPGEAVRAGVTFSASDSLA